MPRAFARLGATKKTWPYLGPLSAAWQVMWDRIEPGETRWRPSRPFRMFSALGIEPTAVTPKHWAAFHRALQEEEKQKSIDSAARRADLRWNTSIGFMGR